MSRTVVLDASAVIALLTAGDHGEWVASVVDGRGVAAPHLVLFEVANVLRRWSLSGRLPSDTVALAHRDLLALPLELWPYHPLAARVRRLTGSLTAYDASYVALAALLATPLVSLDARLARSGDLGCEVLTPA